APLGRLADVRHHLGVGAQAHRARRAGREDLAGRRGLRGGPGGRV
ncbi:MAG: hypothetical protein AVDCRST_MAG06-220, partial [uncultured Nocardioides sp.]